MGKQCIPAISFDTHLYNVYHHISIPSKITDYDYDSEDSNRRFISDIIHTIEFSDLVTHNPISILRFTSESMEEFINILKDAPSFYYPQIIQNPNVYSECGIMMKTKTYIIVFPTNTGDVKIDININGINTSILIKNDELETFIQLIDQEYFEEGFLC